MRMYSLLFLHFYIPTEESRREEVPEDVVLTDADISTLKEEITYHDSNIRVQHRVSFNLFVRRVRRVNLDKVMCDLNCPVQIAAFSLLWSHVHTTLY